MENKSELVLLPSDHEVAEAISAKSVYEERMTHLQQLMFEGDPIDGLAKMDVGERRVCGIRWSYEDTAYRCRTCGLDPTCAICVSCFKKGNHKDHDYSTIEAMDGYCDCGDVTAWKREGFCSSHGTDIKPLEDKLANSMGPILDALFKCWKNKLSEEETRKYANELTAAIVEMLLLFCKHSESLQCFIAVKIISPPGLLEFLIKSEMFLKTDTVKELHELLLKLLQEDYFLYEFAKEFLNYYPLVVKETIRKGDDHRFMPTLYNFSKQIFAAPILTRRLVEEENLLATLFACLEDIFVSSAGNDGCLKSTKWLDFAEITMHVFGDIIVVIDHATVLQRDLSRTWVRLISFIQGIYPVKRENGLDEEEETDMELPFSVGHHIAYINSVLVDGPFDVQTDEEIIFNTSQQDTGDNVNLTHAEKLGHAQIPEYITWLTYDCLRAIDDYLGCCDPAFDRLTNSTDSQNREHLLAINSDLGILSLSDWPDISYEVISQEISIHFPLHQLLSKILQNILRRCVVPDADLFGHLLLGCHPNGFSAFIMEHPLRARVFCAQFRAGMWGDNGIAALAYFDWYLNPHWTEGFESDLFLLQFCAAFAPTDLYIKRILERFGLSEYLSLHLEKSSEYESDLVREMLTLIIQILQERRLCGLSTSQILKRELIYKLAVKDITRSKLVESVPPHLLKSGHFEEILDTVAIYSGPSGWKEGMYSLRSTCWTELDLYLPRWNLKDSQVARDRYRHFCKVSPVTTLLPKWTSICFPLEGVARIATCKSVIHIIRAVLCYAVYADKSTGPRASDEIVITTLHLLSLSLDICSQQKEAGGEIPLLIFASEEIGDEFTNGAAGHSFLSLLVMLMSMYKEENKDNCGNIDLLSLIEIILNKFAHIDSGCITKLHQLVPERVSHDVKRAKFASESDERKTNAREKQAAIMAKMKAEQSKFLSITDSTEVDSDSIGSDSRESSHVVCSLCRESDSSDPVCFLILLQKSKLLSSINKGRSSWEKEQASMDANELVSQYGTNPSSSDSSTSVKTPCTSDDGDRTTSDSFVMFENDIYASFWEEIQTKMLENDELAPEEINQDDAFASEENTGSGKSTSCFDEFDPADCDGVYISSCGHCVHQKCLDLFLSSNQRQTLTDQVEFLCPVCHLLANSILPALPGDFHKVGRQSVDIREGSNSLRLQEALFLMRFISGRIKNNDIVKAASLQRNTGIIPNLEFVTRLISDMYLPRKAGLSPSVILWDALKYSIMSMEVASRCGRNHTSPSHSLNALYREVESPTGFVLSLLVKVVKTLESTNSINVLQRFRGLELFSESICSGVSLRFPSGREGEMLCPDVQFWNWASGPVLSRDPFSTFMWVLFCFPSPFMSCEETFRFLLHIFYLVTVAQALFAYCANGQFKMGDCQYNLIGNMLKILGESGFSRSPNYVAPSGDIMNAIRKSTFPYLRRCTLLWKLLSSTVAVPYSGKDLDWHGLIAMDSDSDMAEIKGVEELEKMFNIPSIETIIEDEMLQSLVLKWVLHFQTTFEARNFICVFYSTPVVPFLLMQLPYLYEDLYYRYRRQCCPVCNESFSEPALCLLCGRLCNQVYCCRESYC